MRSKGFGVIGLILAVTTVALLGLIAWRIWDASQPKGDNSAIQHTDDQPRQLAQTHLNIKELGVKVKLDEKTKNVAYTVAEGSNEAVYIIDPAMKTVDEANQYCRGVTAGMIGLLDRSKDANHWGETPVVVNNTDVFKLGDYYYVFRAPQAECSQDETISQQRATHRQDFLSVLKSLELAS